MKKHSLSTSGLSLSQAQSISNLCFQRTQDIANKISIINNAEKTLRIGNETYVETTGNKIPASIVELILEKGKLHATQAFLMENIKAKDSILKELRSKNFSTLLTYPEYPEIQNFSPERLVDEDWGWEQLPIHQYNEYLEAEAYASHIGQFIHKGEKLDILRKELSTIKTLEWIIVDDGKKTPLKVSIHHTSDELLNIHNSLALLHRQYEQRVNYFKAKVKNLVTDENARISRANADGQAEKSKINDVLRNEYSLAVAKHEETILKLKQEFELLRQEEIKATAQLKIEIDPRFQPVIDMFLKQAE
jgi:hypothetical protein